MSDVTIVTEDAERLVREGGVVNREFIPSRRGNTPSAQLEREVHQPPFTAEVAYEDVTDGHAANCDCWGEQEGLNCPVAVQVLAKAGEVTVTDVHHADDERVRLRGHKEIPVHDHEGRYMGQGQREYDYEDFRPCHPDAKPDMWHWAVEPVETP